MAVTKNLERQELDSTMSKRFIWAVAYGSSIGWGAFILPGDWLASSGTLGATLGITIGGLLMLIIAVAYGALTAKFTVSGGEFAFTYVGFGKYFGFIASWFIVLGFICFVALNASEFCILFIFLMHEELAVCYLSFIYYEVVYIVSFFLSQIQLLSNILSVSLNASVYSLLFKFVLPDLLEVGYLYTIAGWDVYIMEVILSTAVLVIFAYISSKGSGL